MARDLGDDAPRRISDAEQVIRARLRRQADTEREELLELRGNVRHLERALASRRKKDRVAWLALIVAGGALLTGLCWTVLAWGSPDAYLRVDILSGALVLVSGPIAWAVAPRGASSAKLHDELQTERDRLRFLSALLQPALIERRSLYREDVAGIIEQHRADSRKYRLIHNLLQNLITIGSAGTTTIAALETRNAFTWQNITIVATGFIITIAAAFTGYYKYRERSYFLLQTADAIEEEANAFTLGVGPYSDFDLEHEQDALKLFTQRVEDRRNEQRRRQQQLDQPADHAAPTGSTSSP